MSGEEWRQIPGFEGLYEVSSLGRVRSVLPHPKGRTPALHVLTTALHRNGYLNVGLRRSGRRVVVGVHRLVCMAFHGLPAAGEEARHLDSDRTNNTPENLAWGTHADNMQDAVAAGRHFSVNRGRTHCRRDHEFTEANTYVHAGRRVCRACRAMRARNRNTTNKEN